MIAHLRGREEALEPFGWSQEDTEWVAMVCLNSGMFTRTQYADYFNVHRSQSHALRSESRGPRPCRGRAHSRHQHQESHARLPDHPQEHLPGAGSSQRPAQKKGRSCPSISGGSCRSITSSSAQRWNGSRPRMRRFGSVRITACRTIDCRIVFTVERPDASPGIST